MNKEDQDSSKIINSFSHYAPVAGIALIIGGLLLLLDLRIHTGWLTLLIPSFIGLMLVIYGCQQREYTWVIVGIILSGLGSAIFLMLNSALSIFIRSRIGISIISVVVSWFILFLVTAFWKKIIHWGLLFLVAAGLATGLAFVLGNLELLDFIFYISAAIGLVFLFLGLFRKNIFLALPGVLLGTIGAGVYYGWSETTAPGGLQKTGIMLVWFSLGWILITVFSRVLEKRFLWWPLIPGGVLLTTGAGLYIGGNPENALGFLGNTGSIGLILIGIYLLLLKYGMKR